MKCYKCNVKLNHLQLRQVLDEGEQDLYEIECFNPNCRAMNYLSREGYFALKKEISLIAQNIPTLTTRLPSEQNILMISMERTGSSWLAAHISIAHEQMFGVLPKWYHESSRQRCERPTATHPDIPTGWVSVYDVDVKKVLKRNYDKIILLQKDYDALCKDIWLYNHPEKSEDDEFMVRLRTNIKRYWDNMFGDLTILEDPRVIHTTIEDLNNYTFFEFNRILDHLEFPTAGRSHIMAVNPSRNWQVYSDVLPVGYPLCNRLMTIQEKFDMEWVEQRIQERLFFAKQMEVQKNEIEYPFSHKINPYCRSPDEIGIETRSFRITPNMEIVDVLEVLDKKKKEDGK